ncbi:MAG: hypothetical protein FJZ57_05985 [Chlamydiae bacterium]|nr:hypothetical protein [Chlamydiota bacterium]
MIPSCNLEEINSRLRSFNLAPDGKSVGVKAGYSDKEAQKVTEFFIQKISDLRSNKIYLGYTDKMSLLNAAEGHLNAVVSFNAKSLSKGVGGCQKDPMLMAISKLDRLVAAQKAVYFNRSNTMTPEDVAKQFKTKVSKDITLKWLYESTHTERKLKAKYDKSLKEGAHPAPPCANRAVSFRHKLNNSEHAPLACLLHPEEVDFFNNTYTHKQMARLDEHVQLDPVTLHHKILYNGVLTNVDRIDSDLHIAKKGYLYSRDGQTRYYYCQNGGITPFDPCEWTQLPVFRQRKHARSGDDYRLVIKTIINEKEDDKHTWIELKSPTNVYNVGYFWDERDYLTKPWLAKSMRGKLFSLDKNELIGKEGDIQKTVCSITKEQFEKLKFEVERFQNGPKQKIFNLVNSNCTSWTRDIVANVGIDISSKQNMAAVLGGAEMGNCFEEGSALGKIEYFFQGFIAFFRNLLVLALGGASASISRSEFDVNDLPIRGFSDLFSVDRTLMDYPKRVRQWQEAVNEDRKRKEEVLKLTPEFNALSETGKQNELFKVRHTLPVDVRLSNPSRLF